MTFRFKYKFYNKLSINKEAGFFIMIDDEFETIEYCKLDYNNKIIDNKYYYIDEQIKKNIKKIIESNIQIFNLNSYIYTKGKYSSIDQTFYFELNDKNRKIEGNNMFNIKSENEPVKILINIFNKISKELLKNNYILSLNSFKKINSI